MEWRVIWMMNRLCFHVISIIFSNFSLKLDGLTNQPTDQPTNLPTNRRSLLKRWKGGIKMGKDYNYAGSLVRYHCRVPQKALQITSMAYGRHNWVRGSSHQILVDLHTTNKKVNEWINWIKRWNNFDFPESKMPKREENVYSWGFN